MICEYMSHKRLAWAWPFFTIGNAIPRMSAGNQCSSRFVVSVPKRKCASNGRLRGFILTKKYIQVMIISSNTPNTKRASCITILWSIMSCSRQNTKLTPPSIWDIISSPARRGTSFYTVNYLHSFKLLKLIWSHTLCDPDPPWDPQKSKILVGGVSGSWPSLVSFKFPLSSRIESPRVSGIYKKIIVLWHITYVIDYITRRRKK